MSENEDDQIAELASSVDDRNVGDSTVAEALLESLSEHNVEYLFANFGTDHTPLLEAAGRIRKRGGLMPKTVICPHEFVALSAAHGYAAVTGQPQAVLVHVDVGTQNLGCSIHNAYRANAPIFIIAGLAPVSESGLGSRTIGTHYKQDVSDQPGIVDDYCKWVQEYRTPANPDALIARGLSLAKTPPAGPVYLSATREAWETSVETDDRERSVGAMRPSGIDDKRARELADLITDAKAPLVITSKLGASPSAKSGVKTLVEFAEVAGAGVVEHIGATLSFPHDHDQHVGFDPEAVFEHADLILLTAADIPWVPAKGIPRDDAAVVQIDVDPTKPTYPHWDFRVDYAVEADPIRSLARITNELDPVDGKSGRKTWSAIRRRRRMDLEERLETHLDADRLTATIVSDALNRIVDDSTIVLDDVVTNSSTLQSYLKLSQPGSYHSKYGAGLGWGGSAAVGAKMAAPDSRVISIVGDGAYMFAHPAATAWLSAAQDAPTLTVVYNNGGWNAVKSATRRQHPDGDSINDDVPESKFDPSFNLAAPANIVDAYTETVSDRDTLDKVLEDAVTAVDGGIPAVVDVKIDPI